jgi:probable HAF family extracellular repeat protein
MPVQTYTTIDDPLATTMTSARDINNAGQIVGEYIDSSNHLHGFLLSGGTYSPIDDPLATPIAGTSAYGINGSGQIVGKYTDSMNHTHGFLLIGSTYTTLDYSMTSTTTVAWDINTFGQIVGNYVSGGQGHGFLRTNGIYTTLDYPSANQGTFLQGINDKGQIVGWYDDFSLKAHGFLYDNGTFTPLEGPLGAGSFSSWAYAINAAGVIVGAYYDSSFNRNTGQFEVYDIRNNAITSAFNIGTVGPDFEVAGFGPFHAAGASDMILRNRNTGEYFVYDIVNNQITTANSLGAVGLDWSVGGFAADPPSGSSASMGSSDNSTSQLAQAMAGFAGGGAAESLNAAAFGSEMSRQPLLTMPEHA